MNLDFQAALDTSLSECGLSISEETKEKLNIYFETLVEWNEKMNLTALTSPRDVALKHFCDCLKVLSYAKIKEGASVIDVGTGAGFPGLVLKIARPDLKLCLLDSLQKRLIFLEEVCKKAQIEDVRFLHSRAEDGARDATLRESFDYAVSRAVAPMNVLSEYCLPYVKVGGSFLAMKGKEYKEEVSSAQKAIETLGGCISDVHTFKLSDAGQRAIVCIQKTEKTPDTYPRTGKKIKTKPL